MSLGIRSNLWLNKKNSSLKREFFEREPKFYIKMILKNFQFIVLQGNMKTTN